MYKVWTFKNKNKAVYAFTGDIVKNWRAFITVIIREVMRHKKAKLSEADKYEALEGRIKDAGSQWELYEGADVKGIPCVIVRRKENTKNGRKV